MNRLRAIMGWLRPYAARFRVSLRRRSALIGFLILAAGNIIGWYELQQERKARIEHSCQTGLATIREERAMWVEILHEAGVDEPTIDILRRGYDNLPAPAACD